MKVGVCVLVRQNRKLKSEAEELKTENQKLRADISTLFHELEITTEIVWKCACHIPHLINLLFDSSIGEKTLSHLHPFANIPNSPSNNPNLKSPSKRSSVSKRSLGHKKTTPSKSQSRTRQGHTRDKSQKVKRSSVVANLDSFLDDMYSSMKQRANKNTSTDLDFSTLNLTSCHSDYGLYVNVDDLEGSQLSQHIKQEPNQEVAGSNLPNVTSSFDRNQNLLNLPTNLDCHPGIDEQLTRTSKSITQNSESDRPQSANAFHKSSFSTSQSSSSDQVVLKRFSSVPFFEDETDLKFEELERRENSPSFNDTFSDPEASKNQNGGTTNDGNNPRYVSMHAINLTKNLEPSGVRTRADNSSYISGDSDFLRIDLSKPTLEKVKCDWINSLREQVKTKRRLSQSHQNLSTTLGNISFQSERQPSNDPTAFVKTRKERILTKRPDVIPSIISNDETSVSSNSNLYPTHETNFLSSWGKLNFHHKKLIHLQSKESVVPLKLQELLKRDPISELIRVINEIEAVIKIHVNSIYLKYIL